LPYSSYRLFEVIFFVSFLLSKSIDLQQILKSYILDGNCDIAPKGQARYSNVFHLLFSFVLKDDDFR